MTIYYELALRSIDIAIGSIDKITDNLKFDELRLELNSVVIDAVHKIADYYERIKDKDLPDEIDLVFRAFAYLNNQIKHDKELEIIYFEVSGSMYPMRYPIRFGPPGIYWSVFKDNGRSNTRGKREHYEACLMDKDIKATLTTAREIIISTLDMRDMI